MIHRHALKLLSSEPLPNHQSICGPTRSSWELCFPAQWIHRYGANGIPFRSILFRAECGYVWSWLAGVWMEIPPSAHYVFSSLACFTVIADRSAHLLSSDINPLFSFSEKCPGYPSQACSVHFSIIISKSFLHSSKDVFIIKACASSSGASPRPCPCRLSCSTSCGW